jgi:predicted dehydrogenase
MHGALVNVTPNLDTTRNQYKHSMELQVAHFADALRRGVKPMGDGEEMLAVMQLMDAIYRSADQGKEVQL